MAALFEAYYNGLGQPYRQISPTWKQLLGKNEEGPWIRLANTNGTHHGRRIINAEGAYYTFVDMSDEKWPEWEYLDMCKQSGWEAVVEFLYGGRGYKPSPCPNKSNNCCLHPIDKPEQYRPINKQAKFSSN